MNLHYRGEVKSYPGKIQAPIRDVLPEHLKIWREWSNAFDICSRQKNLGE